MHNNKLVLSVRHIGFFILWSSLAVNPAILLRVLVSLTPSSIFIFVLGVKFSIYDEEAAVAWRTEQSATVRYCVHIKRNKVCFPLPLFNKHHRVLSWSLSYFIQNRVVQISLINAKHSCSVRPGSVVGITTAYVLDGPGIESPCGRDFPHLPRSSLRPTQPPAQWVLGLSRG